MNWCSFTANHAARLTTVFAAAAALLFASGCGNGGVTIVPVNGGFSNSSLNGSYSFTVKGYGLNAGSSSAANFFVEGGVFTANGNGIITVGTDDFVEAIGGTTQGFNPSAIKGTYSINKDGTGDLTFNFAAGGSEVFRITLSDTGNLLMEEEDGNGTSAGSAHLQTSTAIPFGTFVFRTRDTQVSATIGTMAISSGAVTGSYVMVQNGAAVSGALAAGDSMTAPDGGRGTVTYTVDGVPHSAYYYVVSSGKFLLLDTTPAILSIGVAEQQSNSTFSAASLSGSYAFGSSGETPTPGFINTVGVFTSDGVSQVRSTYDSVQDGSVASNQTASGTYAVNSDGSGTITLGGLVRDVWMVSPSRAYFITLNGTNVEDGTLDKQSGTFTNSSLSAQAAFFMDGFNWNQVTFGAFSDVAFEDRVGTFVPSGSSTLGSNYVASLFAPDLILGGSNGFALSGTYSVSSNGRATATLNDKAGDSLDVVLYLTSANNGYVLQPDAGYNLSGTFTVQTAP